MCNWGGLKQIAGERFPLSFSFFSPILKGHTSTLLNYTLFKYILWGRGVLYVWYLTQTYVILKSKILNFFCANSQFATYSIQLSAVAIRWKFFLNQNKIFFVNFFSLFYKNYILMMIQKETCLGFGRTVQGRTIYSEFKQLI